MLDYSSGAQLHEKPCIWNDSIAGKDRMRHEAGKHTCLLLKASYTEIEKNHATRGIKPTMTSQDIRHKKAVLLDGFNLIKYLIIDYNNVFSMTAS